MKKRMLAIMMSALMAAGICSGVTVYADADSKTLTVGFDAEYPPSVRIGRICAPYPQVVAADEEKGCRRRL